MGNSKRLLKNTALFFVGDISTKVMSILFIPLYTAYITSSDYGYFDYVSTLVTVLLAIGFQSIPEAVFRFSIEHKETDQIGKSKVLGTALIYSTVLMLGYCLLAWASSLFVNIPYLIWIILLFSLQFYVSIWQSSARALGQNTVFMLSSVASTSVSIVTNIILILVFHLGIESLFLANIASRLAVIIVIEVKIHLFQYFKKSLFSRHLLKQMLVFSVPLAINSISVMLLTLFNRIIVTNMLGADSNGILAISVRISNFASIFTTVFLMAWSEEAYREYNTPNSITYFKSVVDMFGRLTYGAVIIMIPFSKIFFKYIVFGDYRQGIDLLPFAFLSVVIIAQASQLGSLFNAMKRTKSLMTTTLVAGFVSIISCVLLIPFIGLYAAVITPCLGGAIMFILRFRVLKKWINLHLELKPLFINLVLFAIATLVFIKTDFWGNLVSLIILCVVQFYMNKPYIFKMVHFLTKKISKG